jgi:hypothetical protein
MKVIDNLLDVNLANKLEQYIIGQLDQPVWIHGHTFYKEELKNYIVESISPYLASLEKDLAKELKQALLSQGVFTQDPTNYEALIYNAYPLSSVGWHTDKHDEYEHGGSDCLGCRDVAGISIYLNRKWEPNWGGYFLYKENKTSSQGIFYEPIYNRAVINNGRDVHAVSAVTNGSNNRYSVQLFVNRDALRADLQ